jgi:hypothetical protein
MKLHSEMSIGWIIVYAVVLASLSGSTSTEGNSQKTSEANSSAGESIDRKPGQIFRDSSEVFRTNKESNNIRGFK